MSCIRVFPDLKTIFIHIPKTGGLTVCEYLSRIAEPHQKFWREIPERFAHFDRFTIVRNPFDRFISSWIYCTAQDWCKPMAPRDFLFHALDNPLLALPLSVPAEQWQLQQAKHHTAPQTTNAFLLHEANHVYRFENFAETIQALGKRFGFQPGELHLNASRRKPLAEYYDSELEDLVREFFADDFAALGYGLNLP